MHLSKLIKTNLGRAVGTILLVLIGCALTASSNAILTILGDALKKNNLVLFLLIIGINFIADALGGTFKSTANYFFEKQEQEYYHSVRHSITKYFYHQSEDKAKVSHVQNRLTNDLNMLGENYLAPYFKIFACGLDILLSVIIVFTYSWILLLLIIILAVVMLFLPELLSEPLQKATLKVSEKNQSYLDIIEKWFKGLAVLQRYNVKKKLYNVISDGGENLERANINRSKKVNFVNALNQVINGLSQCLILLVAGVLIITGHMNFGVFFSIGNFAGVIFTELVVVVNQISLLQSSKSLNKDLKDQLNFKPIKKENTCNLDTFKSLSINDLSIAFDNGEKIKYPNFSIEAGQKVLLTGDSGTGKSTLFKLLLNEYNPATGEIIFKDNNGNIINPDTSQIGYIPQDPVVFPGTIEENITMFNSKLDKEATYWANNVQLSADLEKFPDGIETNVDLNKNNLSGGQRQKVVLARAETYDSQIILIDEGTSAIDAKNTMNILKKLLNTSATIIFIAHNLTSEMKGMFDREIHLSNNVE